MGEEESSELVVLYASSPERPEIKLVSLLGTIEQLRDSANSDFVITREQLFAVNITNVTTAYYSLLYHANSGAYPADIKSAIRANLSTNGELLLPLAAAIKLMLDFSSEEPGLALPSGYSDVMHWLEDRVASTSYVTRVSRSPYYKEALNNIIDSSDLVNKTVSEDIAGHYFVKSTEINNVPAQLVLNDDATGSWHENARSAEFTWSTSADGLNLDFGWPGLEISTQPVSQFYGANATKYLRQAQLTLASESAVDIIFSAKLKHVTDPPIGINVAPVEETLSSSFKAFKQSSLTDAFTALALEQEYVIPYAGIYP
uniref:Endo-chitinase n=1 Tax=Rheinheimera sp. BAL341 TaxID=1708203 RepID=A0A486XUX4_9GAMM